jgi:hypothetical protein
MLKYVFEDGNIEEAIKLLERRDVQTVSIINLETREDCSDGIEEAACRIL